MVRGSPQSRRKKDIKFLISVVSEVNSILAPIINEKWECWLWFSVGYTAQKEPVFISVFFRGLK